MICKILPVCIRGIIGSLPWNETPVDEHIALQEGDAMAECYKQVYDQLMTDTGDSSHKYATIILPAWQNSDGKTFLWYIPIASHTGRAIAFNMGLAIRHVIQAFINHYATAIIGETMRRLGIKKALPSVRNLLHNVLVIDYKQVLRR